MSHTYKTTGINLKSSPLGESDRLLTILTPEFGLIRAVAVGARKHNSRLGGRSGLFVVNELLIAKGRSLDKVTQAETLESYPGLGQDLKKLTASQYLAELSLCQALSDQPQEDLFYLLSGHLKRVEESPSELVLAHLTQAVFQLLILAGLAPQVHLCCMTHQPLTPDFIDPSWRAGFSIPVGGTVGITVLEQLNANNTPTQKTTNPRPFVQGTQARQVTETAASYRTKTAASRAIALNLPITADQLSILQQLAQAELPQFTSLPCLSQVRDAPSTAVPAVQEPWIAIERILRQYAQYHFDRPIRSATLIDTCFFPLSNTPQTQSYDAIA